MRQVAQIEVPANPDIFRVHQFIYPGAPGIKGVGEKLMENIRDEIVEYPSRCILRFYESLEPVSEPMPAKISDRWAPHLTWWHLYWALQWPGPTLRKALPNGTQMGVLAMFTDIDRPVRVKLDWNEGHDLGKRPSEPGWAWNSGTIFIARELL
ncbi:MAG: hypothetical protein ACM3TU_01930 [Bacillota bacterium]